jgi:hypothetical protein
MPYCPVSESGTSSTATTQAACYSNTWIMRETALDWARRPRIESPRKQRKARLRTGRGQQSGAESGYGNNSASNHFPFTI